MGRAQRPFQSRVAAKLGAFVAVCTVDSGRKAGAVAAIGQGGLQIPREINTIDRGMGRL